jgi:hypothetical protein
MLKGIFVAVLVLHGVIHALGFVKAFGWAELPQLTEPVSRPMGVVWLFAGVLVLAASGALGASVSWFWPLGALAAVVSQLLPTFCFSSPVSRGS